jgi:xanthosine utilization system XapX-like protein
MLVKLLYKPFGIIAGIIGGLLSRRLFNAVWGLVDDQEPPTAKTKRATWPKVLGAAAAQGLTFSVTRAAVDRAGAKSFQHVTGAWPGEKEPAPDAK